MFQQDMNCLLNEITFCYYVKPSITYTVQNKLHIFATKAIKIRKYRYTVSIIYKVAINL